MDAVRWLDDVARDDVASVGGKGANLGELSRGGFPVPPGFVVTADGFREAMNEGGVRADLAELFGEACSQADDPIALAELAQRLQALVRKAGVPGGLAEQVVAADHRLGADIPVAVRSSATADVARRSAGPR